MPIHTPNTLAARDRRLDRRLAAAARVLDAMRAGAVLQLEFTITKSGRRWALAGTRVSDDVARLVVVSASAVAGDDTLFGETAPQTWRWWKNG
jgi:hypothetical protein